MSNKLKRSNLYEVVWDKPMTKVAAEFGISDVGLKKICKKHKIPVPGRGHWAKKAAGHKVKQIPLLKNNDPSLEEIWISGQQASNFPLPIQAAKEEAEAFEARPENLIVVDPKPKQLHLLTEKLQAKLTKQKPSSEGFVQEGFKSNFRVTIGAESIHRLISILDALVKGAEERGFEFIPHEKGLALKVEEEILPFSVIEKTRKVKHEPTARELRELQRWERSGDSDFWKPRIHEWDSVPNGDLAFKFDEGLYSGLRKTYADGKKQRLDKMLNDILAAAKVFSIACKEAKAEWERKQIEWAKEEERRKNARRHYNLEKKRVENLKEFIDLWEQAKLVRGFVADVENRLEDFANKEKAEEWLVWARNYAERLDPLNKKAPKLLHFKDFSSWEFEAW